MTWGKPVVGGFKLSWHPLAGKNGAPTPGFRQTGYPPRPIAFLPFPGTPADSHPDAYTPGKLPLTWRNLVEFAYNDLSMCMGDEFKRFDESTSSRSPAYDLALCTRVLTVTGMEQAPGTTKFYGCDTNPGTGTMTAEFDCPADAWFFAGSSNDTFMPPELVSEI